MDPLGLKHRALHAARRRVVRIDWMNSFLPWSLWCALGAADAIAVAWVLAKRAGRPLTFVQVGSNDGVVHDPLHLVIRTYGWTGVLVEPVPDLYSRLRANYAGVPGLHFENVAIGTEEGTMALYTVTPRPGDPYWVDQLSSFSRATVSSHHDVLEDLEQRIVELPIATTTLPRIVARHRLSSIDLLHVDVEGYDYEVIRQIDFSSSWAPTFVIFERQHLDGPTDRAALRMLRGAGYRCVDIWPDLFAWRAAPRRSARQASSPAPA